MNVRNPFVPTMFLKPAREESADGAHKTMTLQEASKRLSEHVMERAKQESSLYEDVMQAGLGEPLAQVRMKRLIESLVREFSIVLDPETLFDHGDATESLFAHICGAGLIEDLKQLPDVEEVQVIGQHIFLVREGVSTVHPRRFASLEEVRNVQDRLALCGKKPISERQPIVQSYLWNRSRLVMTREPYSDVPSIHIRNFIVRDCSLEKLIALGTINEQMAHLLRLLVTFHASILIGGGTNTGKTTLLYALAREIGDHERIRTLETDFEIALRERLPGQRNILALRETGEAQLSMETAFKPLLVMSPEWIIIGEVRGAEAAQLIQGALRGHDVIGTMHTKYRQSLLSDIVDMIKMDGRNHDEAMCRRRIARAINIVLFLRRVYCEGRWRRVVTEISELFVDEDDRPIVRPLVLWNDDSAQWTFTGAPLSAPLRQHLATRGATEAQFRATGVWS